MAATLLHLLFCFLVFVCSLKDVEGSERCYEELGCFSTRGYPSTYLPRTRNKVRTRFSLQTRRNNEGESISANDLNLILNSNFDPANHTKFIIHGFLESSSEKWVTEMIKSLLTEGDYNVIAVDWAKGSNVGITNYGRAVGNIRIVGAEIALLIKKIQITVGISLSDVHLIGFSLGAHAAGYAGKILDGEIGRITGLDPAGPTFEDIEQVSGRLDSTDAVFVDVIHTERVYLGIEKSVGHLDFYVNNGEDQTGCARVDDDTVFGDIDAIEESYTCDHMRAVQYFTASTNKRHKFLAYSCPNYETYIKGGCFTCGVDRCPRMGLHAEQHHQSQRLYLRTAAEKPYAATEVTIEVNMSSTDSDGDSFKEEGRLYVVGWSGANLDTSYKMCLGEACLQESIITYSTKNQYFKSGRTYRYYTVIPQNLGAIEGIKLSWDESFIDDLLFWLTPKLFIDTVQVIDYPVIGKRLTLCGSGREIKPDRSATFSSQQC